MQLRPLSVSECFEVTPTQYEDARGVFMEWFRADEFEQTIGRGFSLRQANLSVSRRGVARGIHFSRLPIGQAKYVTAMSGSVTDYVVDLRVGSPTYGGWDSVELDTRDHRAVFIAEGIGHLFVATADDSAVAYLTTDIYRPETDRTVSILDPALALTFPVAAAELELSAKDRAAPTLAEAEAAGILPTWSECQALYARSAGAKA